MGRLVVSKDIPETSRATSPGGVSVDERNGIGETRRAPGRNRPRTYHYFRTLPYEVEDEDRRQQDLAEILKHLYIAVQAGDYTPGAVHWTRELRSWLSLKFDPTKEQRVKLVKLYYELSLAPGIDPGVSERFSSMFMLLTKYEISPGWMMSLLTTLQAKTLPQTAKRPHPRLETSVSRDQDLCHSC